MSGLLSCRYHVKASIHSIVKDFICVICLNDARRFKFIVCRSENVPNNRLYVDEWFLISKTLSYNSGKQQGDFFHCFYLVVCYENIFMLYHIFVMPRKYLLQQYWLWQHFSNKRVSVTILKWTSSNKLNKFLVGSLCQCFGWHSFSVKSMPSLCTPDSKCVCKVNDDQFCGECLKEWQTNKLSIAFVI